MEQRKIDVIFMTEKCAVKSCKWTSHDTNNENALDIVLQGGYGDFYDYFDETPPYFRLCHKHAHKFADWINDDVVLSRRAHYHSKREIGYWFGHVGDSGTWLAYITTIFYYLRLDNLKTAMREAKYLNSRTKMWCRENINDSSTPVNKRKYLGELLFDDKNKFI